MIAKVCSEPGCNQLVPAGRCPVHQRIADARRPRNGSTRQWRNTRTYILHRDHWRCVVCGSPHPLEVHHLDGNPLNNDHRNLETRCFQHNPRGGGGVTSRTRRRADTPRQASAREIGVVKGGAGHQGLCGGCWYGGRRCRACRRGSGRGGGPTARSNVARPQYLRSHRCGAVRLHGRSRARQAALPRTGDDSKGRAGGSHSPGSLLLAGVTASWRLGRRAVEADRRGLPRPAAERADPSPRDRRPSELPPGGSRHHRD